MEGAQLGILRECNLKEFLRRPRVNDEQSWRSDIVTGAVCKPYREHTTEQSFMVIYSDRWFDMCPDWHLKPVQLLLPHKYTFFNMNKILPEVYFGEKLHFLWPSNETDFPSTAAYIEQAKYITSWRVTRSQRNWWRLSNLEIVTFCVRTRQQLWEVLQPRCSYINWRTNRLLAAKVDARSQPHFIDPPFPVSYFAFISTVALRPKRGCKVYDGFVNALQYTSGAAS